MAVPKFHEFLLPALRLAADGQIRTVRDCVDQLADELSVSPEDRGIKLPSGTQTRVYNRVGWAITYLVKARLLERPKRGQFRITDRGRSVLVDAPSKINKDWLRRFDEFDEFVSGDGGEPNGGDKIVEPENGGDSTPEELVEAGVSQLNSELADELIDQIKQCSPEFFEKLVIDVLVGMGYGGSRDDAGRAVGQSHDGGIDGIINEDRLGLDMIYVQAKRWENPVGRPVVQAFAGSLEGVRARKGVLITTSAFAEPARQYVGQIEKKIVLIDGRMLARLMIEHDIGVNTIASYQIKRLDGDYFEPTV